MHDRDPLPPVCARGFATGWRPGRWNRARDEDLSFSIGTVTVRLQIR
jgi:hypothetical protein